MRSNKYIPDDKKREVEWDVLKGILMICVITGHLDVSEYVRTYIYSFHMPLFFLISGYFYHPVVNEDYIPKSSSRTNTFFKRLRRVISKKTYALLYPYLTMLILNYLAWIILYRPQNILSPIIHIFWTNTVDGLPIAGALWFLTALFFVFIFALFLDYIKTDGWLIISIVMFAIIGSVLNLLSFRLPLALDCAFEGTAFFELGYYIKKKGLMTTFIHKLSKQWIVVISCICLLISLPLIFLNGTVNFRDLEFACLPITWINVVLSLITYMGFSVILTEGMSKFACFVSRELQFIGRNTMVFMGFHQLARWGAVRVVNRLLPGNSWGIAVLRIVVCVVCCIIACQIITWIFNLIRPLKKCLHISI